MNVTLIYKNSEYNLELVKTTPLSFLYKKAEEKFKLEKNNIELYFDETLIPNSNKSSLDFFQSTKKCIIKIVEKNSKNEKNEKNEKKEKEKNLLKSRLSVSLPKIPKKKTSKKHYITCQLCKKKDSMFYCRNCNEFICLECNIKYPIHNEHKTINLENGNLKGNIDIYKKILLEELNIIKIAFNTSSEWIIDEQIRFEYIQNLIDFIKEIDVKTFEFSASKTSYNVQLEFLNEIKVELFNIETPNFKDEIIDVFTQMSEKEKMLNNFAIFVNLQVLKSQFNKKMIDIFEKIQINLNDILSDVNNKLNEVKQINDYGLKELMEYNDSNSEASTKAEENTNNTNTNNNINNNINNNSNNNTNNNTHNNTNNNTNNNFNFYSNNNNYIYNNYLKSFPTINKNINLNNNTDANISAFAERMAPICSWRKNKKIYNDGESFRLNKSIVNFSEYNKNVNNNSLNNNNQSFFNTFIQKKNSFEINNSPVTINQYNDKKINNNTNTDNVTFYSSKYNNSINHSIHRENSNNLNGHYSPIKLKDNSNKIKYILSQSKSKKNNKNDVIDTGSIINVLNSPVKKKKKYK